MFTCVCTYAHVELMSDVFLDLSPRISIEAELSLNLAFTDSATLAS